MTTLQTGRLLLKPLELEHFDAFAAMAAEPEVMEFLSFDGKPLTRFQAWQAFASSAGHWTLRGFGWFGVFERESGDFVGRIGPWHPEGWPGFEVGWALCSKYWGRGYATEAAAATISYSFNELGQGKVISLIDPANVRSIGVAERLGEKREGTVTLAHAPNKSLFQYAISKDEWDASLWR